MSSQNMPTESSQRPPSKLEQLKAQLAETQVKSADAIDDLDTVRLDSRRTLAEIKGLENYYELRNKWSVYIVRALVAILVLQFLLVVFVGFGWWKFENNSTFLALVTGQNFGEIIGLCVIVAKCLFPPTGPPIASPRRNSKK